jgi:hypothetical protein
VPVDHPAVIFSNPADMAILEGPKLAEASTDGDEVTSGVEEDAVDGSGVTVLRDALLTLPDEETTVFVAYRYEVAAIRGECYKVHSIFVSLQRVLEFGFIDADFPQFVHPQVVVLALTADG